MEEFSQSLYYKLMKSMNLLLLYEEKLVHQAGLKIKNFCTFEQHILLQVLPKHIIYYARIGFLSFLLCTGKHS